MSAVDKSGIRVAMDGYPQLTGHERLRTNSAMYADSPALLDNDASMESNFFKLENKQLGDVVIRLTSVRKEFPIKGRDAPNSGWWSRLMSFFSSDSSSSGSDDSQTAPATSMSSDQMNNPNAGGTEPTSVIALKDVSLNERSDFPPVRAGEFVMIRGPSGGGKTTLLNMLGTLDSPSSGIIEILGAVIDSDSSDRFLANLRLHEIGFVFQTFNLISTMTALENVSLPMVIKGKLSRKEIKRRAVNLLESVGLGDRIDHLPSELSGGEQQRVTIARSLSNAPRILLLDEPTGDLDTKNTIQTMDLLLRINQEQGTTCVMVTHNPDLECYADRILYVKDGRFSSQAINRVQTNIDIEAYMEYIAVDYH